MQPYKFKFGSHDWPENVTALQLYAPVDLTVNTELGKLISRWRDALAGAPISLVEDRWLHVTLEMISDKDGACISIDERAELAAAVREALTDTPVFLGRAGSALAYKSGALIDISPAAPLVEMHKAIRRAVHAVRGPTSTAYSVPKPHISLGYATAEDDSDPWQRKLRRIDPNGAPLHLKEVHLVEVNANQRDCRLWWHLIDKIALEEC